MSRKKINVDFYNKLGATGLSALMDKKRTAGYLRFLKKALPKHGHILDLACGYGRLTIPLAQAGYKIEGIDLAPNLIREARKEATTKNLNISFKIGNMIKLPYTNKTFDAVICMWSSFNELLQTTDQIKAMKEMVRITKRGGLILVDLPVIPKSKTQKHLRTVNIAGLEHASFAHDQKTLTDMLQRTNIKGTIISRKTVGGRRRLLLTIHL